MGDRGHRKDPPIRVAGSAEVDGRDRSLAPKKSLSQNFLRDKSVVRAIVAALPKERDVVVEIGPGPGALTRELLPVCPTLWAIEKDPRMVDALTLEFGGLAHFHLVQGDAVKDFWGPHSSPSIVLVGNLPYAITGAIFRRLVLDSARVTCAIVMVQKEVGDRLRATPGGKERGALSVFAQSQFQIERVVRVFPGAFFPPPKVESVVVKLIRHTSPIVCDEAFEKVVASAFQQRRKTLRNSLSSVLDADGLKAAAEHLDLSLRAEVLSVSDFDRLATVYRHQHTRPAAP